MDPFPSLLLALLAAAAPHQPGDWPIFRGDSGLRGRAEGELPEAPGLLWTHTIEKAITSSPTVSDGRVFFGADDQRVHALRASDGEELWSHPTEDVIEAPALCQGGRVFIGSSDGRLYCLQAATGELLWSFPTEDKILGGANFLAAEGELPERVVVGSYDGKLYCLMAATGALSWSYTTGNYVNATPAVCEGRIVFGGCDAVLHVVDGRDGQALAEIPLGSEAHVAGSVALDAGRVYLGHYGNEFICVDWESHATLWRFGDGKNAFFSSPALAPERVLFGGRDKKLHCLDRADGHELWSYPTKRKLDSSPILCGERIVLGTAEGRLLVLALADGRELWSYDLGSELYASPAVADGRIFVVTADGRACAFGAASESEKGGPR